MNFRRALLLVSFALLWIACQADQQAHGRYEAIQVGVAGNPTRLVTLSLNDGGKGSWSVDEEYVEFRWEAVVGDEIWIHTSTGGSLIGTFVKRSPPVLRISFPGGVLEFQKIES